ncbi:MAG TPA: cytochrome P450 [Vicinamibacterales bacterium]
MSSVLPLRSTSVPGVSARSRNLLQLRRETRDPIGFLQHVASQGDVAEFSLGARRAFLVSHPEQIERVLITDQAKFSKPPALERTARLLGRGLLTSDAALNMTRRRVIAPVFHREQMTRYAGIIVSHASGRAARWTDGDSVDIADEMTTLALRVVGECLFSADLETSTGEIRDLLRTAVEALDPLVVLVSPMRRLRPVRDRLHALVREMIARQIADPHDNLLRLLLDARGPEATPEQLLDDALTMLLAGHDTIANALTWTWQWMSDTPDAAARFRAELTEALDGRAPSADDLPRLRYTRAVLAEALRLSPPAWVLARRALEDHRCGGVVIPRGSLVIMSPYLVHRDARFHPDPLSFRPERWLADAAPRPRLAFFPFGAGRRSCIGEGFAWMEGVLVLATVGQRWRLVSTGPTREFDPRITLRPRGPQMMRVERIAPAESDVD